MLIASTGLAANSAFSRATQAGKQAREAASREDLVGAAKGFASAGEKIDQLKKLYTRLMELTYEEYKARFAEVRSKTDRLKALSSESITDATRIHKEMDDALSRLNKTYDADHTALLCDAGKWSMRFISAYCADAIVNPGTYSDETVAFAAKTVEDFVKNKSKALHPIHRKDTVFVDQLMGLCSANITMAVKVGCWKQWRNGELTDESAIEWADKARRSIDDKARMIRVGASNDESPETANIIKTCELAARSEVAQIYWMAGDHEKAIDELRAAVASSGTDSALKELGLTRQSVLFPMGTVAGFARWAAHALELAPSLISAPKA